MVLKNFEKCVVSITCGGKPYASLGLSLGWLSGVSCWNANSSQARHNSFGNSAGFIPNSSSWETPSMQPTWEEKILRAGRGYTVHATDLGRETQTDSTHSPRGGVVLRVDHSSRNRGFVQCFSLAAASDDCSPCSYYFPTIIGLHPVKAVTKLFTPNMNEHGVS